MSSPLAWPLLALAGAILGGGFVLLARAYRQRSSFLLAAGLAVAALIYLGFGVSGGATGPWLLLEVGGLLVFGGVAWRGSQGRPGLLALGWAFHALWDAPLHLSGIAASYTPAWYPPICLGFDLAVAVGILVVAERRTSL